jgi:nitrogen fixation protein NifU and related proteins
MNQLSELYQEVILDHNRRPRNFGSLPDADGIAEGYNPLCGDRVKVFLRQQDGRIEAVTFEGTGCAISTASASLMTEVLKGKTLAQAKDLFQKFHDMVTGKVASDVEDEDLERLVVFHRLHEYPVRVKCATLVWHALLSALNSSSEKAATEQAL